MKLHEIHQRTTTELLGLVGAKEAGWALAVIELNRRGIHVEFNAESDTVRISAPSSPRETLRFHVRKLSMRFFLGFAFFAKWLKSKKKKRANSK